MQILAASRASRKANGLTMRNRSELVSQENGIRRANLVQLSAQRKYLFGANHWKLSANCVVPPAAKSEEIMAGRNQDSIFNAEETL